MTPLRLKILLACSTQGCHGGMEATVLALAQWLKNQPGYEVRVLFKLTGGSTAEDLVEHCKSIGIQPQIVSSASVQLLKNILWADIIHANNAPPDILFPAKLLGKPVALTIHHQGHSSNPIRKWVWRLGSSLADIRCYNSQFVWNIWEPKSKQCRSYRIPTMPTLPPKQGILEDRCGFFFISRWIKNKGARILLNAYKNANIDREKWPLTMAGTGLLVDEAKAFITENDLTSVHLLGYLSEEEKYNQIRKSKWLVAPPNTAEDLGLTPIEARSQGVPSIITRDGGLPESAGPSAITCTPGSTKSLTRALELATHLSENEYTRRSQEAYESLNDYLYPLSFYQKLYSTLIDKGDNVI